MTKPAFWILCLLFCVAPLRAATVPPPQQYNQMARETICQCSRVSVDYGFVDMQGGNSIPLGKVGLIPQDATLLANAISVSQRIIDPPGLGYGSRWLQFYFYNGDKVVGVASAMLSERNGSIILEGWNKRISDYYLTTESAQALRDWALKQPQLAKKFPH